MRKVGLLCTLLLGTCLALAQSNATWTARDIPQRSVRPAAQDSSARQQFVTDEMNVGRILAYPPEEQRGLRSGEDCPADSLYGQDTNPSCNSFYYADLNFCSGGLCQRVRYENFPPPGVTPPSTPIGVVRWRGCFLDDNVPPSGCDKPGAEFRIRFYPIGTDGGPDPNTPYPYEYHVPIRASTTEVANFGGAMPARVWLFTVVLDTPVALTSGWMGLTCVTGPGTCVHLWDSSDEGDDIIYEDWESDGWNPTQRPVTACEGLNYCFAEKKIGACCDDCNKVCEDNVTDIYCDGIGGRFFHNGTCATLTPPCGEAFGACCSDNGDCVQTKCCDCISCGTPPCVGDLNCDGTINFGDINPFVLYLSNIAAWHDAFPGCPTENGDINCDGVMGQGSFGDINPFVALMTQCGSGCACPGPINCGGPRAQGQYWAGGGTPCPGGCCTVVVPAGATLENEPNDCAVPDTFNGGCDYTPANFSPITCGQTIYGESGTFGTGDRDRDWYRVTVGSAQSFTVTVEAEFDVALSAYHEGPTPSDPCTGYAEVAAPVGPAFGEHNKCTQVVVATRCLPAGTYFFAVTPALSEGVPCGADYKITLQCTPCTYPPCQPACPGDGYHEGTADPDPPPPDYCVFDPQNPTSDPENGGCNETPPVFEPLPVTPSDPNDTFAICGKLWASNGARDLDWYGLNLQNRAQVFWTVDSEVPCRATILFWADGTLYTPPPTDCSSYYYWVDTLCVPCVQKAWTTSTAFYEPGFYWFLVAPEEQDPQAAAGYSLPVFYGYPCPIGSADLGNDYVINMTIHKITCQTEILAKPHGPTEQAGDPPCPPTGYDDTYNSGCDHTPTGPALNLGFDAANGWISQSGTWLTDPNDPNSLKKDYDWYKITLTANRRFKVYLYADFQASWEIWKDNDCAYGPIEGLGLPTPCYDAGVFTVHCYPTGSYWLRVFPTNRADCGAYYYLALTEAGACSVCNYACSGSDLDDPCDDVTDYDTNAGCDDPNAPPPHFMTFNCSATYCGRSYAKIYPNGLGYYDPDWFQITQTNTNARRIRLAVTAEFLAHVEVYVSCADYNAGTVIAGLDGITTLLVGTACPNMTLTSIGNFPQNTTVYGRLTIVDQFGNLLTNYYPCAKGFNRWRIAVTCIV